MDLLLVVLCLADVIGVLVTIEEVEKVGARGIQKKDIELILFWKDILIDLRYSFTLINTIRIIILLMRNS